MPRIYAVDSIELTLEKSLPPNLLIELCGRTNTPKWTNISLVPSGEHIAPPADGVQDFDVVGEPPAPGTIVLQVLAKVRTNHVIEKVDLDNYWGPGLPLRGVRCHAQENSKVMLLQPAPGMAPVTERADPASAEASELSFDRDIRPLFRRQDIGTMIAVRNLDLSSHADVSSHAELILERLSDGTMPCDGAWPAADIDMFRRWIAQGKKA